VCEETTWRIAIVRPHVHLNHEDPITSVFMSRESLAGAGGWTSDDSTHRTMLPDPDSRSCSIVSVHFKRACPGSENTNAYESLSAFVQCRGWACTCRSVGTTDSTNGPGEWAVTAKTHHQRDQRKSAQLCLGACLWRDRELSVRWHHQYLQWRGPGGPKKRGIQHRCAALCSVPQDRLYRTNRLP
jgi:hypothetical protein